MLSLTSVATTAQIPDLLAEQPRRLIQPGPITVLGFTGTGKLRQEHHWLVEQRLKELAHQFGGSYNVRVVTGAQTGVDAFVADWMERAMPCATHHVIIPYAPHDKGTASRFTYLDSVQWNICVERMPHPNCSSLDKRRNAIAYRERDQRIVDWVLAGRQQPGDADSRLEAFPLHEEKRMPRSGTWLTVRLGRKAGIPIVEHVLDPRDDQVALF